ncbi:MAG: homoserine dehydrogenase [Abitibacteriaceae bacterium]|nr:homoserine dehydrogenase [Abditibacteriaceae bacterium]MBV9868083.1 homoserine dehydrogenase [Abditibacteriaceae bacterium]
MQINVGILGLGTVGGGTLQLLQRNAKLIQRRTGCEIGVTAIVVKNLEKARPLAFDAALLSNDPDAILNDPSIHIVAELIGGVAPARDYVLRAIAAGKSVVTANKELIAKHGAEIMAAADQAGVDFRFEGSVGGGIPLIKPLRESLAGNHVRQLMGIVNGTTNFILTKMTREGRDFEEVLAQAQALGYAEADPSADVDGYDTMYKLAILAGIAFGAPVSIQDIYREGIRHVHARDIEYARELGYVIKLVALARQDPDGEIELRVHPALLPTEHPLANVNDVFNAVFIQGDAVGDVMFYGRGAGSDPTGSAVVGDIIEVARNLCRGKSGQLASEAAHPLRIKDFADVETRFCVRMQVADRPGMMAQIATVFGEKGVSIESIVQKKSDGETAEIFWMSHRTTQRAMARSLNEFNRLDAVRDVASVIRVEGE